MAGARGGREQAIQQSRTVRRDLVELQRRPARFGDDRHQPGAGRRFEHLVARPDLGGQHRQGGQGRRRGELVERDLLLAAAGVGQGQVGDAGQQSRDLGRSVLEPANLRAEPTQLQDQGRLDGVVGVAPRPGALGVRAPEGDGHGAGHQLAIQRPRPIEVRGERPGGGQRVGGLVLGGAWGLKGAEEGECRVHGGDLPITRGGGLLPPVPSGSPSPLPSPLL